MKKIIIFACILFSGGIFGSCGLFRNTAVVPAHREEAWWLNRSKAFNEICRRKKVDLVFIGDSITHGWKLSGKKAWNKYYMRRNPANFGIAADKTQHVLWRIDNGNLEQCNPKAAVLLIGSNNQRQNSAPEIAEGVARIAARLTEIKPDMKVIILSILPCGEKPNKYRDRLRESNRIISGLHNGTVIFYVDIFDRFLGENEKIPRALMPDFLHPSEKGYEIMAEGIEPVLKKFL